MSKIFAFIGSPKKQNSGTLALVQQAMEYLSEPRESLEVKIYTSGTIHIEACTGCCTCMRRGFCPLDDRDQMAELKEEMLQADFIIWGSPVYSIHISSDMKRFIDRLAYWGHLLKLAGKPGMVVCTAGGGGHKETNQYLKKILCGTGVKVIGGYSALTQTAGGFKNPQHMRNQGIRMARCMESYLRGGKKVKSDLDLELAFKIMKMKVTHFRDDMPADFLHWKENRMLSYSSFHQWLREKQKW